VVKVSLGVTDVTPLAAAVQKAGANLNRELWVVTHKTVYWARKQALKNAGQVINTAQKNLAPVFYYKKNPPHSMTLMVNSVRGGSGISLRYFSPRQLSRKRGGGVSVKPYSKNGSGKIEMKSAFMFPQGKNVYIRYGKGRRDYKLARYPQTVETFRDAAMDQAIISGIRARMIKEVKARVRYLTHLAAGTLRGKQPQYGKSKA